MILKDNLYTLIKKEISPETAKYEVSLLADNFIYKAHFPDNPITPGVCIVQVAKELVEDLTGNRLVIAKIKNVKFLSTLSPLQTPVVTFTITHVSSGDSRETSARVSIESGFQCYAKISFTLKRDARR